MRWKTKARLTATAYILGLMVAANLGTGSAADAGAPVVELPAGQAAIIKAEEDARRQLHLFLGNILNADGVAHDDAAVKIIMSSENGPAEVIWVTPFSALGGGQFVGMLANTPQVIKNHAEGDAVYFDESQIRDWSFVGPDSRIYGSYTTRVLLPHLSKAQADQIGAYLSPRPIPADW